ncbi:hypothetical protein JOD26_000606 [Limosilactobacillus caviae]
MVVNQLVGLRPLVIDGNKVDRAGYQIERWLKSLN